MPEGRVCNLQHQKSHFGPFSFRIKFTWSHKIFKAQIKITRHIAKVLYSVMLQGRGVAIISEVRGNRNFKCSNNNNKYYNIYVCIIKKKYYRLLLIGEEIKSTAGQ